MATIAGPIGPTLTIAVTSCREVSRRGVRLKPGEVVRLLPNPSAKPFRIGRDPSMSLRLGYRYGDRAEDTSISGTIAEVCFRDGLWMLTNRSVSHPLQIHDPRHDLWLPVAPDPEHGDSYPLGPPSTVVSVPSRLGRYRLRFDVDAPDVHLTRCPHGGTTVRIVRPNENTTVGRREIIVLAAKFLYDGVPVRALPDREALELADSVLPHHVDGYDPLVPRAIERFTSKWAKRLRDAAGIDVGSGDNNALGTQLLAWGVLRPADSEYLRLPGPGAPGVGGVGGLISPVRRRPEPLPSRA